MSLRTAVAFLKTIKQPQKGLPQSVFDVLVRLVPFVACEMVVVNRRREILLTFRRDEFWQGWHFPGGLMRFNDSFKKRLKETAKKELGVEIKSCKFLFPVNYRYSKSIPRGHAVSLIFLCEILGKPKEGEWFKKMPKNIIYEHKKVWLEVKNKLR